MLKGLERKAYTASLTLGVIALFIISLLLLGAALYLLLFNKDRMMPAFIFSLMGGLAALIGSLIWYVMKAREYMRAESLELDMKYPGFYDYYHEWQSKIDEITSRPDVY